jgi:hypothetical protein
MLINFPIHGSQRIERHDPFIRPEVLIVVFQERVSIEQIKQYANDIETNGKVVSLALNLADINPYRI